MRREVSPTTPPGSSRMYRDRAISPVWFSAAVIGSLWASIEIVVGSFLHNIHFPLSGTILSAFGVLLLVSFDRLTPSRGLFWRSGVICAAMKTLSPSAIILGPMIGILAESLLLEGGVFFLGRTVPGYIVGGALAVTSSLVQKLLGTILFYGANVVVLYSKMVEFAAAATGMHNLSPNGLLIGLLLVDLVLGGTVAAMGTIIGRRRMSMDLMPEIGPIAPDTVTETAVAGRHSIPMLVMFIAGIAGGLAALNIVSPLQGAGWTAMFCSVVFIRHPRLVRQLARPRLWAEMILITLLAGWLLGGAGRGGRLDGLTQGVEMCLRAIVLLFGFAAVGFELRNPAIVRWFREHRMGGFVSAMNIAFAVLPRMLSITSSRPDWIRHPFRNISGTIHGVYRWTVRMRGQRIIVSGSKDSGKTSFVSDFVRLAQKRGLQVRGFLARGIWKEGVKRSFILHEISSGKELLFCSMDGPPGDPTVGRYHISPDGLAFGREILSASEVRAADVIVIDEVGSLELRGDGWAASLNRLTTSGIPMVLVVRSELVDQVQSRWKLEDDPLIDIASSTPEMLLDRLLG